MLESVEIRWFYKDNLPNDLSWDNLIEDSKNKSWVEMRSDYYLLIKNCDYLGIKFRNARLEIKWRKDHRLYSNSKSKIQGILEHWIRISWDNQNSSNDLNDFLKIYKSNPWIKVDKKRLQKKFCFDNDSLIEVDPRQLNSDCAIEITELYIVDQKWWSIGIDLFKSISDLSRIDDLVKNPWVILFQSVLKSNTSYGYPTWLSKIKP